MAKDVKYMQNFGEVAPTLLISPQKTSSHPKLETILEEGSQDYEVVVPKRVLFVLPLVLSMVIYLFLYKDVVLIGRAN